MSNKIFFLKIIYNAILGGISEGKHRNPPRRILGGICGDIFGGIAKGCPGEIFYKIPGIISEETADKVSERNLGDF